MHSILVQIATELGVRTEQVAATVALLDEGATVPFIARYRKEVTGSLDDIQLRSLEERLSYLRDMDSRRNTILASIEEQGKLTDSLRQQINTAATKTALEDLYLPYKPKRRTKGQIAIEAGLEPLANALFEHPDRSPEAQALLYVDASKGVEDTKAAMDGARYILMERFAEDAALLGRLRSFLWQEGVVRSTVVPGKETDGQKFSDYFEFDERLIKIPSHRALALFRGRNEGVLQLQIDVQGEEAGAPSACEGMIASHFNIQAQGRPGDKYLSDVVRWTWKVKLLTHLESELFANVRTDAETEAIKVFARNLKSLLLAAPAGQKATLGLDPGLRTGVKYALVDETGQVVAHGAIYPHQPHNKLRESEQIISALCKEHQVALIAIGNGTASRETDRFVADMIKNHPTITAKSVVVNEAGASIYSASEFASREFPHLDVTIRGAISIARRLQDPLAELVKIDPKSIGVGQYQHDVSQTALARQLDAVVEDCVNSVGVDINTASVPLLSRVAGLSDTMSQNIVEWRNQNGFFRNRQQLLSIPRVGPKAFEQAAGFLRITGGDNPLDASSVHPESYPVVDKIIQQLNCPVSTLIGDVSLLRSIDVPALVDQKAGLLTIKDILAELEKPGRDPRPEFKTATLQDGVETIKDLKLGMVLEGTVTNVTNFGAFVDVGVHQDGLVHISALSNKFVDDPAKVVSTGDIVKVKVMAVDIPRKRIGLSMRMDDTPAADTDDQLRTTRQPSGKAARAPQSAAPANSTMADLMKQAMNKSKNRL
jgi:uncharacterized protein